MLQVHVRAMVAHACCLNSAGTELHVLCMMPNSSKPHVREGNGMFMQLMQCVGAS